MITDASSITADTCTGVDMRFRGQLPLGNGVYLLTDMRQVSRDGKRTYVVVGLSAPMRQRMTVPEELRYLMAGNTKSVYALRVEKGSFDLVELNFEQRQEYKLIKGIQGEPIRNVSNRRQKYIEGILNQSRESHSFNREDSMSCTILNELRVNATNQTTKQISTLHTKLSATDMFSRMKKPPTEIISLEKHYPHITIQELSELTAWYKTNWGSDTPSNILIRRDTEHDMFCSWISRDTPHSTIIREIFEQYPDLDIRYEYFCGSVNFCGGTNRKGDGTLDEWKGRYKGSRGR